MDFQFPSLSFLLSFFFFLFMLVKLFTRTKPLVNLPPGPMQLPFIGNLHQLAFCYLSGKVPHRIASTISKIYGPIMSFKFGELQVIVVSSASLAEEILLTNNLVFPQRPFTLTSNVLLYDSTDLLFAPNGTYWRQMRKICTMQLLSVKGVASNQSIREEGVTNMIKDIKDHSEPTLNLTLIVYSYMYSVIGKAIAGYKSKDQEGFIKLCQTCFKTSVLNVADMFPSSELIHAINKFKLKRLQVKIEKELDTVIDNHKMKKLKEDETGDLVDVLLRLQKDAHHEFDSPITDSNVKAVIVGMVVAGGESSASTLEWIMAELLRKPQIMKRVQTEVREAFKDTGIIDETKLSKLKYLQAIIQETLRLHPTAPVLRECREDFVVAGYTVPAKAWVYINVWHIGRDSTKWTEPKEFNPERFLDSNVDYRGTHFYYLPFGAGRRMCPGITSALWNIQIALASLLYHFDWSLPNGTRPEELDMTEESGLITKKDDLIVMATPLSSV